MKFIIRGEALSCVICLEICAEYKWRGEGFNESGDVSGISVVRRRNIQRSKGDRKSMELWDRYRYCGVL